MITSEKYPVLFGKSERDNYQESKELRGVKEVAEYICNEGIKCQGVVIFTPKDKPLLCTNGIYLDIINDLEYRSDLLKILVPMQQRIQMNVLAW